MSNIDDLVPSKSNFLTKEDVGEQGVDLAIKKFEQQEVGFEDDKEMKYVIVWTNSDYKPMVLNRENASRLKMIAKSDDTDDMIGMTVNVYCDPFVSFGKKVVGGLRLRPAFNQRTGRQPQQKEDGPPTPPAEAYEDEANREEVPW